jgi:glycosyltransferase involved in cell wall biosynthesis
VQLSVIIPAYEAHGFVGDALDSLAQQRLPAGVSLQAIMVSDDGTDYSCHFTPHRAEAMHWTVASTGRIGAGASAARNVGLGLATGDFISFLDADDVWLPERARILLFQAQIHGAAVCTTAIVPFTARQLISAPTVLTGHGLLTPIQALQIDGGFCPVYRRDCITHTWDESVDFAEDVLFNHTAVSNAGGLYVHPEPLMLYRIRPDSATHAMPQASHRAERAYARILSRLEQSRRCCAVAAELAERFERKRALNAEYLQAWTARPDLSFEEFIRTRDLLEC